MPVGAILWTSLGCASGAGRVSDPADPQPEPPVLEAPAGETRAESGVSDDLWSVPAEELGTQRIVRLRYEGPGDDGTLYLTLRLERPERYTLEAHARLLGKSVFRLMVRDDRALFVDLQRTEYCLFDRAIEISAIPLGPLPFDVLPALLLGRIPARPDGSGLTRGETGGWAFRDEQGRRWEASAVDGELESWTLYEADGPAVWWSRDGDVSYLSARAEELQLRWRAGKPEPLAAELGPLSVPEGYVAGTDCG